MIKHLPEETVEIILQIFNHIWTKQVFPDTWRNVLTIPVLKPGKNKKDTSNYRPIAMSNILSKILQKMVNKRLTWVLESKNIIHNSQNGFRSNRSTTDSIINLTEEIQKAFKRKQELIAVFLDIEKAYDTTWKQYILQQLKRHGINGNMFYFIQNFLKNRKFEVKVNGHLSQERNQTNGVPQGEILSVILFLLAINGIFDYLTEGNIKIQLFADDLTIFYRGRNIITTKTLIQKAIKEIEKWSEKTGFRISTNKTKAIRFSKKQTIFNPRLKIYNNEIEYVKKIKYLGVIMDNKLTWRQHIEYIKKECIQRMNLIKTLRHQNWGADRETLIKIYKALIRSKIDYACICYSTAKPSYLKKINTIQNTAIKMATGAFHTSPTISLHCESGEIPLDQRRNLLSLSYIYNLAQNPNNPPFNQFFTRKRNQIKLNNETDIQKHITNIHETLHLPTLKPQKNELQTPPWKIQPPKYNTEMCTHNKHTTPPELIRATFQEIKNRYQNHKFIYTDGSHINGKTGAAFIIEDRAYKFHLPPECSNFTAEAFSIMEAVKLIKKDEANNNYIICTDSLAVVESLKQQKTNKTIIHTIKENIHQALSNGKEIELLWIPSHCGITGNEKADEAAKSAIEEPKIQIPIPKFDLKSLIKNKINKQWQDQWTQTTENKLRTIKTDTTKWKDLEKRKDQIIMSRLRIGHSCITHKHILEHTEPPTCEHCNTQTITSIKHILMDCEQHREQRLKHKIPNTLTEALSNNIQTAKKVIMYLKDTNMYNKI